MENKLGLKQNTALKTFAKYVSLNILGMIGLSCYILADTYFISNAIGINGLAALNLALPCFSIMNATGLMLGIGGASRYSTLVAQDKQSDANRVFTQTTMIGLILGIIFMFIGIFSSSPLASALGADADTHSYAGTYLKILLSFAPLFIINNIFVAFVRNDKNPNLAMIAVLVGTFSNVFLDYAFMYPLNMGMFGAALATGFAPVFGICVSSIHLLRKKGALRFVKTGLAPRSIVKTAAMGGASFVIEISMGISMLVFNLLILKYSGNTGVAAYGIVANVAMVVIAVFVGIAQGIQPIISDAHGREDRQTVKKTTTYALILAIIIAAIIYAIVAPLSQPITSIFNKTGDTQLMSIASQGLIIYFASFFFAGISLIGAAVLSAVEKPRFGLLISLLRGVVLLVPIVFLFSYLWEMLGIWLSIVVTEGLTCIVASILLIKENKISKKEGLISPSFILKTIFNTAPPSSFLPPPLPPLGAPAK